MNSPNLRYQELFILEHDNLIISYLSMAVIFNKDNHEE